MGTARRGSDAVLMALLVLSAAGASATPPDVYTADLVMLGGSDSLAVFLVSTGFNLGSHYLWETKWFLLAMELPGFSFRWRSLGSMVFAEDDYGGISYTPPNNATSIPEALSGWGVERPYSFRGFGRYTPFGEMFGYIIKDSLLHATYGGSSFPLPNARCFDPSPLAFPGTDLMRYCDVREDSPVQEVTELQYLSRFPEGDGEWIELEVAAEASAGSLHISVMRLVGDAMPFDVIFTVPLGDLEAARDSFML